MLHLLNKRRNRLTKVNADTAHWLCEVFCILQNLQRCEVPERASDGKASRAIWREPEGISPDQYYWRNVVWCDNHNRCVDPCSDLRTIWETDNLGMWRMWKWMWSTSLSKTSILKSGLSAMDRKVNFKSSFDWPTKIFPRYLATEIKWHFKWCFERSVLMCCDLSDIMK